MKINRMSKLILIIALFLIAIPKVDAARILCTTSNYSDMKAKAYKTNFSYEFIQTEDNDYYFEIYATGLPEGVEISYGGITYSYKEGKNVIQLLPRFEGGKTYSFNLYAATGYPCVGELLYTKKITLPKFNTYSLYRECVEYEEFPLCHKWYKGEIKSYDDFHKKLDAYIKSLEKEDKPQEQPKEKNIFEKIIEFYVNNLVITVPLTIIVVGGIVFIVIRKIYLKKNRVKIDI